MKLYFSPGACSLAPHIALREAGLSFDLERVNLGKKETASGLDYRAINPKGSVPCLELDGGERLTEVAVLLQYIADQNPGSGLIPAAGTLARYHTLETLNFISSEIHKGFSPLFWPTLPADFRPTLVGRLMERLTLADGMLQGKTYLAGDTFSVADIYLFVVSNWSKFVQLDISGLKNLGPFLGRVAERPAVLAALKAEGLL